MASHYKKFALTLSINAVLYALFAGLLIASLALARTRTPVGNEQFLRSMIPHHSSAIPARF
jgi:uncharacterized protein (DUF305 family)